MEDEFFDRLIDGECGEDGDYSVMLERDEDGVIEMYTYPVLEARSACVLFDILVAHPDTLRVLMRCPHGAIVDQWESPRLTDDEAVAPDMSPVDPRQLSLDLPEPPSSFDTLVSDAMFLKQMLGMFPGMPLGTVH